MTFGFAGGQHVCVAGLRSELTDWCSHVVGRVLGSRATLLPANTTAEALTAVLRAKSSCILATWRPDQNLRSALGNGVRCILSGAPPSRSVQYLMRTERIGELEAIRMVFADLAAIVELGSSPTYLLAASDGAAAGSDGVRAIAAHLGVTCSPDDAARIAADSRAVLDGSGTEQPPLPPGLSRTLSGADAMFVAASNAAVEIPPEFFFSSPGKAVSGPSVTVRVDDRLLVYGPYLALPTGRWTARCRFMFSDSLVGADLSIDVVHHHDGFHQLAYNSFRVPFAGEAEAVVPFMHTEPAGLLEVRLFQHPPGHEGTVEIRAIQLQRSEI